MSEIMLRSIATAFTFIDCRYFIREKHQCRTRYVYLKRENCSIESHYSTQCKWCRTLETKKAVKANDLEAIKKSMGIPCHITDILNRVSGTKLKVSVNWSGMVRAEWHINRHFTHYVIHSSPTADAAVVFITPNTHPAVHENERPRYWIETNKAWNSRKSIEDGNHETIWLGGRTHPSVSHKTCMSCRTDTPTDTQIGTQTDTLLRDTQKKVYITAGHRKSEQETWNVRSYLVQWTPTTTSTI